MGYSLIVLALATLPAQSVLTVGGKALELTGPSECMQTINGTIYDLPATIWSVRQNSANKDLSVTLFRTRKGDDMFSLFVFAAGKTHQVSTVKVGVKGNIRGSGNIKFVPAAAGGSFSVDATTETGVRIVGTLVCPKFATPSAVGG